MQIKRITTPYGRKLEYSTGDEVIWTNYIYLRPARKSVIWMLTALTFVGLASALVALNPTSCSKAGPILHEIRYSVARTAKTRRIPAFVAELANRQMQHFVRPIWLQE